MRGAWVRPDVEEDLAGAALADGARVVLTAGSSPSPAVCWLVGREGVVLITTDEGRSWQRVPFPQAIDLISIRASDGTTAAVVGADGRSFTTSDRGVTWKQ